VFAGLTDRPGINIKEVKMKNYRGKVAIVTGAGSGIGRALAQELARRGAHVVISDINSERIESVGKGIQDGGGKTTVLTVDVSDYEAVKNMVENTVSEHGRLDFIFNNAGIAVMGQVRDYTIDDWRNVIDVNLYGEIYGIFAAYPIMIKQGYGHIVNTASIEGLVPFPGTASYVASKFGIVGLSHTLRMEAEPLGVKVSVVCPGHIETAIFDDGKTANVDRETAMKPLLMVPSGTPEKCARVILRGVEKNKATILVTPTAWIFYWIQRISPGLMFFLQKKTFGKAVIKARLKD
jgi:NAD(P)-dependent dehydrogenase (short-subunit alcohol dehydrogenase family)